MAKILIEVNEKKGTFEGRDYHNYQLFVRDTLRPEKDQIIMKKCKASVWQAMDLNPFEVKGMEISWFCDDYGNIAQIAIN